MADEIWEVGNRVTSATGVVAIGIRGEHAWLDADEMIRWELDQVGPHDVEPPAPMPEEPGVYRFKCRVWWDSEMGEYGTILSEWPEFADPVYTRLDERDPIRQLWPEVVEALEESNRLALVPTTEYGPPSKRAQIRERQELAATIDRLLTRIRALTPEGGHNGAGARYDTHDWPGSRQQWSGPKPCQRCGVLSDDPGAEEPCRKTHSDPITTPEGGEQP